MFILWSSHIGDWFYGLGFQTFHSFLPTSRVGLTLVAQQLNPGGRRSVK